MSDNENADKIVYIKNKLSRIFFENFEITHYKNDNKTIEIFFSLKDEPFDLEIYKEIDGFAHYYCPFRNNKREYDFSQKNINRFGRDVIRNIPNFVEIFSDRLDYWLF
jgi:hypothetical protein